MIALDVPGFGTLHIAHVVCDFNGTLACDGRLIRGAAMRLKALARHAKIHVLTADTFGTARVALARIPCDVHILGPRHQSAAKRAFVQSLGAKNVAAIGNGRNDRGMLAVAALSIAVCGPEGIAREAVESADILVPTLGHGLDLLRRPRRLTATLRD